MNSEPLLVHSPLHCTSTNELEAYYQLLQLQRSTPPFIFLYNVQLSLNRPVNQEGAKTT